MGHRKGRNLTTRANSLDEMAVLSSLEALSGNLPKDEQERAARVLVGELERWAPKAAANILRRRQRALDHLVADAIQETLLRVMTRGKPSASSGKEAAAWIARVFHNALIDELRRLGRTPALGNQANTTPRPQLDAERLPESLDLAQTLEKLRKRSSEQSSSPKVQRALRRCVALLDESINSSNGDGLSVGTRTASSAKRQHGPASKQALKRAKNRVYQARRRARLLLAELLAVGEATEAGKVGK